MRDSALNADIATAAPWILLHEQIEAGSRFSSWEVPVQTIWWSLQTQHAFREACNDSRMIPHPISPPFSTDFVLVHARHQRGIASNVKLPMTLQVVGVF